MRADIKVKGNEMINRDIRCLSKIEDSLKIYPIFTQGVTFKGVVKYNPLTSLNVYYIKGQWKAIYALKEEI